MVIIVNKVFAVDVQNCRTELESRYVAWLRIFGNKEVTEATIMAETSTPFITFTADADLIRPLIKNLT